VASVTSVLGPRILTWCLGLSLSPIRGDGGGLGVSIVLMVG
jgi:hypothetical protein